MAVNSPLPIASELKPVAGVEIGFAEAGIKSRTARRAGDEAGADRHRGRRVHAEPLLRRAGADRQSPSGGRQNQRQPIAALLVNTGNANAGTGELGLSLANETCAALAQQLGCEAAQILPFSTGVILEPLPAAKVIAGLPQAVAGLKADNWYNAAEAIMTTDTQPKAGSRSVTIGGHSVT
jgi:glutamate N-acetyltransferase/amino-acid N-acetyltransferase